MFTRAKWDDIRANRRSLESVVQFLRSRKWHWPWPNVIYIYSLHFRLLILFTDLVFRYNEINRNSLLRNFKISPPTSSSLNSLSKTSQNWFTFMFVQLFSLLKWVVTALFPTVKKCLFTDWLRGGIFSAHTCCLNDEAQKNSLSWNVTKIRDSFELTWSAKSFEEIIRSPSD